MSGRKVRDAAKQQTWRHEIYRLSARRPFVVGGAEDYYLMYDSLLFGLRVYSED